MPPSGLRRPNDPPLLILVSLADGPKHGHALARDIEGFADVTLGPGALYGAITRLEERGLIEPLASDDRRRPYRITATGSAELARALGDMRRIASTGTARLGGRCTREPQLVQLQLIDVGVNESDGMIDGNVVVENFREEGMLITSHTFDEAHSLFYDGIPSFDTIWALQRTSARRLLLFLYVRSGPKPLSFER
jgi:DNA-binding PadR family transcriptional regulator